jgi:hypothetical protein
MESQGTKAALGLPLERPTDRMKWLVEALNIKK